MNHRRLRKSRREQLVHWLHAESLEARAMLTAGDFNQNGQLDADDMDQLSAAVRSGATEDIFDLNGDGAVDQNDRATWVRDLRRTYFGDANLDGLFDSRDLVKIFEANEFEDQIPGNSSWATGDWNGDGDFTTADFVVAFEDSGFEGGPRIGLEYVPTVPMHNDGRVVEVPLVVHGSTVDGLRLSLRNIPAGISVSQIDDRLEISAYATQQGHLTVPPAGTRSFELVDRHGQVTQIQLDLRGTTAELVRGVLVVQGTDLADEITIHADDNQLSVRDKSVHVGSFSRNDVRAIQIVGGASDDRIDVSELDVPAWLYGGSGNDTIYGGRANDHIFGGATPNTDGPGYVPDLDSLFGGAGDDVIFADNGAAIIQGGAGADFFSFANRRTLDSLVDDMAIELDFDAEEDQDIETQSFAERTYFEMMRRYRDAFGLTINHDGSGQPADINDAGIFTGIALITAALRQDSQAAGSLIESLRNGLWFQENGTTVMARHPNSFLYMRAGTNPIGEVLYGRTGHQPITKDGLVGILPGLLYAFRTHGLDQSVRDAARDLMDAILSYLEQTRFKTLDEYPESWRETVPKPNDSGKDNFANIFERGGGTITAKGPEGYMLAPTDMYALQNIAAELGFVTAHWDPLVNYGPGLALLGDEYGRALDAAIDPILDKVKSGVTEFLDAIDVEVPGSEYSFHVIPGVDATLVKGSISIDIPQSVTDDIATLISETVKTAIKLLPAPVAGGIPIGSPEALQVLQYYAQLGAVTERLADRVLDALPDWVQADRWRPVVMDAVQQVLPWFNGNLIGELVAFYLGNELAKRDEIVSHLHFWTTLSMYETRPEMVDLLGPGVTNVHQSLSSGMDMLLFDWLAGDNATVDRWLEGFEQPDSTFENLAYAWKKPNTENAQNIANSLTAYPTHHRLDYLVLDVLNNHGIPESATEIIGDWADHWGSLVEDAANQIGRVLEQAWLDLRDNLVGFVQRLVQEFDLSALELARGLWGNITNDLGQLARGLWSGGAVSGLPELATTLFDVSGNLADVVDALVNNTEGVGANLGRLVDALWGPVTRDLNELVSALWGTATDNLGELARVIYAKVTQDYSRIASSLFAEATTNIGSIASAIWSIGPSEPHHVARALYDSVTRDLSRIARALYDQVDDNLGSIAGALWNMGIGGISRAEIARAIWNMGVGGIDRSDIARAIYDGITRDLPNIARAVYDGLSTDLGNISWALWNMGVGGISRGEIARAIWNMGVGGIDRSDIARGIYDGITTNLSSIARAVYDGLSTDLGNISWALWNMGVGGISRGEIARAIWNMGVGGIDRSDIARGIYDGITTNLSSIARAVYDGLSTDLGNISWALWNMGVGGISRGEIARAIWNMGVGGIDRSDIARGIYDGITTNLSSIARAIHDGLTSDLGNIVWSLWNMGIGGLSYFDMASAIWNMGIGGISRTQIANALVGGIGISFASAWSVVTGL